MSLRALAIVLSLSTAAEAAPLARSGATKAAQAKTATSKLVGKKAAAFTLTDLAGKRVKLSSFKGKTVVLEWFNPECPYVQSSHTVGSLGDTARRHTKQGVVWLAINSSAVRTQGHEPALNKAAAKEWSLSHPILRDVDGKVGKAYGATHTPHMFVIDPAGIVVYAGAIDNSPDGECTSAEGGMLINYVDAAIADLAAKRTVKVSSTKAYGCAVTYAS